MIRVILNERTFMREKDCDMKNDLPRKTPLWIWWLLLLVGCIIQIIGQLVELQTHALVTYAIIILGAILFIWGEAKLCATNKGTPRKEPYKVRCFIAVIILTIILFFYLGITSALMGQNGGYVRYVKFYLFATWLWRAIAGCKNASGVKKDSSFKTRICFKRSVHSLAKNNVAFPMKKVTSENAKTIEISSSFENSLWVKVVVGLVVIVVLLSAYLLFKHYQTKMLFREGEEYYTAKLWIDAVEAFEKAAENGHVGALSRLGDCYAKGRGVTKNHSKAFRWYYKAAKQGEVNAQYEVARSYKYGRGIDKDYTEAVKWFRISANKGFMNSQFELGVCYALGEGVEECQTEANKWFILAAEQDHAMAQSELGVRYKTGCGFEKDELKAAEWYLKAARKGIVNAQYEVGLCYLNGIGFLEDRDKGFMWLRKAKRAGDLRAKEAIWRAFHVIEFDDLEE